MRSRQALPAADAGGRRAVRSSPCSKPCQYGAVCGCSRRISVGSVAMDGFATPRKHDPGSDPSTRWHGRTPAAPSPPQLHKTGGAIPMPTRHSTLNRAGGERLRPPLRHHRIHTPLHRIPDQLRASQPRDRTDPTPGKPAARQNGSNTTHGRSSRDRTATLSSKSSTLVKATNAEPGAPRRAGVSRSSVLPLPCGPKHQLSGPTAPTTPHHVVHWPDPAANSPHPE
jgi:hypothetical protein